MTVVGRGLERRCEERSVADLMGLIDSWTKLLESLRSAEQKCERIAALTKADAEAAREWLDSARRSAAEARLDLLRSLSVLAASDPAAGEAHRAVKSLSPYPSAEVAQSTVDLLEGLEKTPRYPTAESEPADRSHPRDSASQSEAPTVRQEDPALGPAGELLTAKQLEAWTRLDAKTIYGYVGKGLIPYVKIQSSVRFRRGDIVAWLEKQSFRPC